MLLVPAIASFVVLATSVAAFRPNPHYSLAISRHIDTQHKHYPVQRDQKRITHLKNKANRVSSSNLVEDSEAAELPLNNTGSCYEAKIGIGNPPTYCKSCVDFLSGIYSSMFWAILDNLVVDTGSSNTWVGANAPYVKTNTSVNISELTVSIASYPDCWTSSN
jgi:cathepsin E